MNRLSREIHAFLYDIYVNDQERFSSISALLEKTHEYKCAKKAAEKASVVPSYGACLVHAQKKAQEFITCSGKRSVVIGDDIRDPYEPRKRQLPNTNFYYCTYYKCFRPTWYDVECNDASYSFLYSRHRKETMAAWNAVKDSLFQHKVGTASECLIPATMFISGGDHLYFMEDASSRQIKIGVSKNPSSRLYMVEREHGREDLKIIHVVDNGGYELEAFLHRKFHAHRVWRRQEWFSDSKEIRDYIEAVSNGVDPWGD